MRGSPAHILSAGRGAYDPPGGGGSALQQPTTATWGGFRVVKRQKRSPSSAPAPAVPDDPRAYLPGGESRQVRQAAVLAYFADRGAAEAAAADLRDAGLGPVSLDTVRPQPMDRANLNEQPYPRLDLQNTVDAGLPLNRNTQHTTLVAVGAAGKAAERARAILHHHGGQTSGDVGG